MEDQIQWFDFIRAFDYTTTHKKTDSILRWQSYQVDEEGISFRCLTALENPAMIRVDVIQPHIIRLRMNPDDISDRPSEMLVEGALAGAEFQVSEEKDQLVIETDRLRVVFPRQPWGMQVYDRQDPQRKEPVFLQQTTDRAYGPGYEVPPIGFQQGQGGLAEVRETVAVGPGEAFYGFGERFTALDKWGQELKFWAVDSGNVSSYRAYKNIPFFISSAGYGLFTHSSSPMVYRMGSESNISYSIHLLDQQLDYFLIYGPDYKDILASYAGLTGFAPVPPKWSFGFWISRCMYTSRQQTEAVVEGMRQRGFPCDVISLDPYWMGEAPWCTYRFDEQAFPDPAGMMAAFKEQGVKTCLWITSYLPEGTPYFDEAREKGYLILTPEGDPAPVLEAFAGVNLAAVDFTKPEAVIWWQDILRGLLDLGAATFKTDFAEQAPIEAVYSDGRSGIEMHNLYPLLYNGTAFELTREYFGRGLVWGRSAYAGSQRYPVQWGGDSYSSFGQIKGQLQALLGYGMSGVPFCSHDIGGFDYVPEAFDEEVQEGHPMDPEVYIRWLQFGAFSSHMRAHGKQPREPWEYGPEVEAIAMDFLKLRYRLLPYIYTEAVRSTRSALPMARPLLLEYQDDPNTRGIDLQYMFGKDFLVAPILSRDDRREVYLPEGTWFDYWTKKDLSGGRWIEVSAPLSRIPLYVRQGALIPYGPEMDYVDQVPLDPLELEFYGLDGKLETEIFDEDQPTISIEAGLSEGRLEVKLDLAPSRVILRGFGFSIQELVVNGISVDTRPIDQGWEGCFPGRELIES